jgi:addiction module RelE/StbE family toxin
MKVVYRARARADLAAIHEYIHERSPKAAKDVVRRIRIAVARLQDFPSLGRPGRFPGVRELVVSGLPYIVVYRLEADRVEIVGVFHGARKRVD